jgi:hypothetical protein
MLPNHGKEDENERGFYAQKYNFEIEEIMLI